MADWRHGFYKLTRAQRQSLVARQFDLSAQQEQLLNQQVDPVNQEMVENYLTSYHLPQGIAVNLVVDQQEYVVPMVTEEPSVIAAASNGAKLVAKSGGFQTTADTAMMIGQVVLTQVDNTIIDWLKQHESELLQVANQAKPSMQRRGGGAKKAQLRSLKHGWVSIDLMIDTDEAMGANSVNTMCEAVGNWLSDNGLHVLTAILSNLATQSLQTATCKINAADLVTESMSGDEVGQRIADLSELAQIDPYRATTHNKGIMNGIDAVLIATGNDWRAIESGAHAYAAIGGVYKGLSTWRFEKSQLIGSITLPLPVGIVGGSIDIVPLVKINQRIMKVNSAQQLAQVIASVGLAQNLAALRALATNGIQVGHMKLQYRSLALSVGAKPAEIDALVARLQNEQHVDHQFAIQELEQLRKELNNGRN
ncbi:hydroxymethylglutaryl-CoA reductase [Paucilactobacillus hokkaidonensis JCM 18461]|uniref:3-hydroxy-3-methylglutaryl coenzyme A reductase n=2 Tax=Paucilactobacillus hokkaidonensis TaxID=1193095 RepID=A0A0A1GV62_9LACO|nr:hydroxymethylglutaryl-CoA reductase, degradative [Paucilactobacillus hokkaidonensis]KRO09677.1 hydroxymethylglutaryl-CoA reductase [Paucilactobacillus hokkaidonensis]BAP84934.1 hydroxymethylglutaryl-CoA reductase [Paucilactobacillus hokkaidonensis JCM 18461]